MIKKKFIFKKNIKIIFLILLLFLITSLVFIYTVQIRKPWFGTYSWDHHQWLSGSTLKFSKIWYEDGLINSKFLMYENPKSIEFPNLTSRMPYISYPPGTIIPPYMLGKISGKEPALSLIMSYNLTNHFLIAFFLALIIFFLLLSFNFNLITCFFFSLIPMSIELLSPSTLYWHQNVFFADQAVILPFVLFIFIEVLRDYLNKDYKIITLLQLIIMFWGSYTDPSLFFFIVLLTYFKRLIFREYSLTSFKRFIIDSLNYWSPLILAGILYFLQIILINPKEWFNKILYRTSLNQNAGNYITSFDNSFWQGHMYNAYNSIIPKILPTIFFIILIILLFIIIHRIIVKKNIDHKIEKITSLIFITLFPCFMEIYTFRNHTSIHDFSILKFSIPIALIFVLIPLLIIFIINETSIYIIKIFKIIYKYKIMIILILCLILTGIFLHERHPKYVYFFPNPDPNIEKIGYFINNNTEYNDIVISPDIDIGINPPQLISYSMKRVYKTNSYYDIINGVKNIKENYTINIFYFKTSNLTNPNLRDLINYSYKKIQKDNMELYKINKEDFLNFSRRYENK